jgi:hypothetical protein
MAERLKGARVFAAVGQEVLGVDERGLEAVEIGSKGLQSFFRIGSPNGKISRETVSYPCYKSCHYDL